MFWINGSTETQFLILKEACPSFLSDLGDDECVADEDGDVGDELDEDDLGPHSVYQEVPMVEANVWKDECCHDVLCACDK